LRQPFARQTIDKLKSNLNCHDYKANKRNMWN